jgi:hypothetical protein
MQFHARIGEIAVRAIHAGFVTAQAAFENCSRHPQISQIANRVSSVKICVICG